MDYLSFFFLFIYHHDSTVKIIKLFPHCGQQYALFAGFEFIQGDVVVVMDGDLQNDPKDIPLFLAEIEAGFDFVNGCRIYRVDTMARKIISKCATLMLRLRTGIRLQDYGCGFVALKQELVTALKDHNRITRFIKPLILTIADSYCEININHYPREKGRSKYKITNILFWGIDFFLHFHGIPKSKQCSPYKIERVMSAA